LRAMVYIDHIEETGACRWISLYRLRLSELLLVLLWCIEVQIHYVGWLRGLFNFF
jgi:hypothetical protein